MFNAATVSAEPDWSGQQTDIFGWFETPINVLRSTNEPVHLVVVARAGTGKTTTILKAIQFAPERKILLCAFNKKIADALQIGLNAVNPNAVAKTLHSVGFSIVRQVRPGLRVENDSQKGDRKRALAFEACGASVPDDVLKLVAELHTKAREIAPHARMLGELTDMMYAFELEPSDEMIRNGYDAEYVEKMALVAMEIGSKAQTGLMDFSDMIFLPVRNRWLKPQFDMVVVDEAQDMTVAQLEIATGICRGRVVVVGDNMQAIYGFRGADSESLGRLKVQLRAKELGLTTTYRCGKAIVALAQELVEDFQAGPKNPEGSVENLAMDKLATTVTNGDFVLSRVNAPLVSIAMQLLKNGQRARIAGKDIGRGLISLIRKLSKGASNLDIFLDRLVAWEQRECEKMRAAKRDERVEEIQDKAEMLVNLAEDARDIREIEQRVEALFSDDGYGQQGVVTCSSIHRAKGLEANRVFILADTLRDHSQEEKNIRYVAITRAKQTLVWVR